MLDIAVIEEPAAAESSLAPTRSRILAALAEPGSAAMLAGRLELPRQKVTYHLKELERHGLVEFAEELTQAVTALVSHYHDESDPKGRTHRVIVGMYQAPDAPSSTPEGPAEPPHSKSGGRRGRESAAQQEDPR